MSTVPTPADVMRRKAHPLIAPGPHDPATDEPYRALWERGITGTRLLSHTKLVALLLATHADWATGRIPEEAQPRLGRLIDLTALPTGQIVASLSVLEERGWLARDDRRRRWNVASVQLTIPGPIMRRLKQAARTTS
ncbi:hypothetical protein ACGFZH_21005 [Streptomyces zaomyceticus]|uniref:hypothetical protein n=1 Tax=Streptomyces zaomyceticus TaxID=68286 RepID=UPI0037186A19